MPRIRTLALAGAAAALSACATDRPAAPPRALPVAPTDASADITPASISLTKIGNVDGGGAAAAEITAFDHVTKRLFVVNGALGTVDVIDLQDPANPVKLTTLSVTQFGASANSVDTHDGVVAVAIQGTSRHRPERSPSTTLPRSM